MNAEMAVQWLKAHRWWVALMLVILAGYMVGKDAALRDNARDAEQLSQGRAG